MNESILLVEDDAGLRQAMTGALAQSGYATTVAPDGIQAAKRLRADNFDLVLLDIGLPFVDGWTILHQLHGRALPSVIVVSARDGEDDKVRALDMGADDFLTKPFGAEELLARIRAVLRRSHLPNSEMTVSCGEVVVNLAARAVLRGGEEIALTPTEWALLSVLAERRGTVIDHRTLLAKVWGPEYVGDRQYLRTFIQRLRSKLEADPANPQVLVTAGRLGYRFGAPDSN